MELPTRRVIMKRTGLEALINASEFDPQHHDELPPPSDEGKPDIYELIAKAETVEALDALVSDDNPKKVRKAIDARREELTK